MTTPAVITSPTLPEVARKRAWQTAAQGLAVDLVVAVAVLVLSSVDQITSRAALLTFAITLAKTVVSTACAWVIRRYRDRSGFEASEPVETVPIEPVFDPDAAAIPDTDGVLP